MLKTHHDRYTDAHSHCTSQLARSSRFTGGHDGASQKVAARKRLAGGDGCATAIRGHVAWRQTLLRQSSRNGLFVNYRALHTPQGTPPCRVSCVSLRKARGDGRSTPCTQRPLRFAHAVYPATSPAQQLALPPCPSQPPRRTRMCPLTALPPHLQRDHPPAARRRCS